MGKLIIAYCVLMLAFISNSAFAAYTFEAEPGILEMTTSNAQGFIIKDIYEHKAKDGKKVYFCLKEVRGNLKRCFYGNKEDFKVLKMGSLLNGIQYKLKYRIENNRNQIPLKSAAYFYKVTVIRPQI